MRSISRTEMDEMPMTLPGLYEGERTTVKYSQRMAEYYSHLAKVASREICGNEKICFAKSMHIPLKAMRIQALDTERKEDLRGDFQIEFMRQLIEESFGLNYGERETIAATWLLEQAFSQDLANLKRSTLSKLSRFCDIFAEQLPKEIVKYSGGNNLTIYNPIANVKAFPFIRYLWVGDLPVDKERIIEVPRDLSPSVHDGEITRIDRIRMAANRVRV